MDFTNVKWPCWYGRACLYDEIYFRSLRLAIKRLPNYSWGSLLKLWIGRWVSFVSPSETGNIKEHYQALNRFYQEHGDHALAGDFHYGEMEMKRREFGWPFRVLCPEFVYWFFSGYGTRPFRALLVLVIISLFATLGIFYTNSSSFNDSFQDSLQFAIKTMTLQRPKVSSDFPMSESGQWIQIVLTILGPIQIALLGLSLRMRLKK